MLIRHHVLKPFWYIGCWDILGGPMWGGFALGATGKKEPQYEFKLIKWMCRGTLAYPGYLCV